MFWIKTHKFYYHKVPEKLRCNILHTLLKIPDILQSVVRSKQKKTSWFAQSYPKPQVFKHQWKVFPGLKFKTRDWSHPSAFQDGRTTRNSLMARKYLFCVVNTPLSPSWSKPNTPVLEIPLNGKYPRPTFSPLATWLPCCPAPQHIFTLLNFPQLLASHCYTDRLVGILQHELTFQELM